MVVEAMSWTFAWEDQIRSRYWNSMHLQIPTPHHTVPNQKPTRSPRPRSRKIGVSDRSVRFREERDSPRHHLDLSSDRELTEEPRGKMPRRAETRESDVPFHSSEASSSELQQVSTVAASDIPSGERLYMSMTEEGPSGDYR